MLTLVSIFSISRGPLLLLPPVTRANRRLAWAYKLLILTLSGSAGIVKVFFTRHTVRVIVSCKPQLLYRVSKVVIHVVLRADSHRVKI